MSATYTTDLASQLPALPLPPLADTLTTIPHWTAPLATASEQADLQAKITAATAELTDLHAQLQAQATATTGSWLAPIWLDGYLRSRGPLQATSNFNLTITPASLPSTLSLPALTAQLIAGFTRIYLDFANGVTPIETNRQGAPIDMAYYQHFFKSIREPHPDRDQIYHGDEAITHQHVAVIHLGHLYQVTVTDATGLPVPLADLTEQLAAIWAVTDPSAVPYPGIISGLPREAAATAQAALTADPQNAATLTMVKEALLVVTLLPAATDATDFLTQTLLGPIDRQFDKTQQLIIDANKRVGMSWEHSDIDGVPAITILQTVIQRLTTEAPTVTTHPPLTEAQWHLDETQQSLITEAQTRVATTAQTLRFAGQSLTTIGKTALKAAHVSPDAFVQTAFTLALFRITHDWHSIYEPVSMRQFYEGRTDVARVVSSEKRAFVEAFVANPQDPDVRDRFEAAMTAHTQRLHAVQQGHGIERHMTGMASIAALHWDAYPATHALLASPAWQALTTDFFSTTAVPAAFVENFSFAPTADPGIGLYYGVLPDHLTLTVSAATDGDLTPDQWLTALTKAVTDLMTWLTA